MNPKIDAYTVAMPWYERADFAQLLELADDRNEMSQDYDAWRAKALSVAEHFLARGKVLQMVTIKPGEFLAWIRERQLPNTAATRLRYVEMMAVAHFGAGSLPPREVDHARPDEPKEDLMRKARSVPSAP